MGRGVSPFREVILAGLLLAVLGGPALAAPLFPDVPEAHRARDAVAALAAKGLVEGYPDGTFKGDRAASRWEVAMVVARLLAKMEQEHATFATRAELEGLRKLVGALREELDALGVRVANLEEGVGRLDKRVGELERITFYGRIEARFVAQTFRNTGQPDNDSQRNGAGPPNGVPFLNYDDTVGTAPGPRLRPQQNGIFPVVDYERGKALTNGTGFTSRADLGVKVRVSDDLEAGAEFAAYTSQGDQFVDAYWGVSAPYLSNPFVASSAGGFPINASQPLNNQPLTRMTLDHFWLAHGPSKTRVVLGYYDKVRIDPIVYAGQPNTGVFGPKWFPGYGFNVSGEVDLGEGRALDGEAFGTRFGHGTNFLGNSYQNYGAGGDLGFKTKQAKVRLNFMRIAEEAPAGGPLVVGLHGGMNVRYGASTGWTVRQWVNPPGHFALQRSAVEQASTGAAGGVLIPNTADTRPIVGWNGALDNAVGFGGAGGGGNYGPQSQDVYGVTGEYRWELGEKEWVRVRGEWAHSDYKPNRNSGFVSGGDATRAQVDAVLLGGDLELGAHFLSVDPQYGALGWQNNVLGGRSPRTWVFMGAFHTHDAGRYPHNREGFGLQGKWKFDEGRGTLWARAELLDQKRTSLYDVRAVPNSLGAGIPNFPVLGFAPGFVEVHFFGYANPLMYGPTSANSFTAALQPLEDPRGSVDLYAVGLSKKWDDPKVTVQAAYEHRDIVRRSGLPVATGGSQNHVDLDTDYAMLDVSWGFADRWTLRGGVDYVRAGGHFDPAGLYNSYANSIASTTFVNLDSEQWIPSLGFEHHLSENADWNITVSHYDTNDRVPAAVRAGNDPNSIGNTAHPFSWEGWQVLSQFKLSF